MIYHLFNVLMLGILYLRSCVYFLALATLLRGLAVVFTAGARTVHVAQLALIQLHYGGTNFVRLLFT